MKKHKSIETMDVRTLDWSETRGVGAEGTAETDDEPLPGYIRKAVERADAGDSLPGEPGDRMVDGVVIPEFEPSPLVRGHIAVEISNSGSRTKQGGLALWCQTCGDFIDVAKTRLTGCCPVCGQPMVKQRCIRCGHEWWPRDPTVLPGSCPRCKSPYYNRRRRR